MRWDREPRRTPDGAWLAFVLVPKAQFPAGAAEREAQAEDEHVFANWAMIRSGAARAARLPERYRFKLMFLRAEERAREARLGIWQDP